jgi:preprotein translocase subunit YajC
MSSDLFLVPSAQAQTPAESAAPAPAPVAPAAGDTKNVAQVPAGVPAKAPPQNNAMEWVWTLGWMLALLAIVYFLMIRPEKKRAQERKSLLDKLQRGNKVVTIGGLHGEIVSVKDDTVILLVDAEKGATLKFSRSAINNVITESSSEEKK